MKYIIYSILFITVIGCKSKEAESTTEESTVITDDRVFITNEQWEKNSMKLVTVEEQDFPTTIKVVGKIDVPPTNKVVLTAKMGGFIKSIPLLVGDKVKKGQRLVTIENQEFVAMQQQYLETKQEIAFLKSEFERQKALFDEKITSERNFLKAKRDFEVAQTTLVSLEKQLQMINISASKLNSNSITSVTGIYAPISGNVTKIKAVTGSYISPADEILEIIDNKHLHLELSVFEKDALKLKVGQEISFRVPELSSEVYKAKVHLIGKSINENRTVDVHAHIEEEQKRNFLSGMFAEAVIQTNSNKVNSLPETSVVEVEGEMYGLVLDENSKDGYFFKKQKVIIGNTFENNVELKTSEIKKEAKFLEKGVFNLLTE
ncbi:cobalt-zinc-cadmium efflux system membrane fusion protein [Tenacibaculum lutimaris]|uniref:Cobalt-zinc-cadmium efflux system membrane fusion protein n=1 Tax=Tenacibaculum lutimaris TaxID=285258 RepID=A0A420E0S9_9FLAO|nr:efflux RND transporter periplasmic adaptor subunit [Tenacibaculum lutimaris]RKF03702.1 cobalt-zinc-cadmium efflux system membrane fusion protein [Tenacibaculum lutimaris]